MADKKKNELVDLDKALGGLNGDFTENMIEEDIVYPRLRLMQPLSDLVNEGVASPGQVVLNIDGHTYNAPGGRIEFIPLYYWHSRLYFSSLEDGGGILCRAEDGKRGDGTPGGLCSQCGMKEWGMDGERRIPPSCLRIHNFAVLIPKETGEHRIAILPFSKTSFKVGSTILNRLRMQKRPPFAYSYCLKPKLEDGGKYKYWVLNLDKWEDTNRIDQDIDQYDDWPSLLEEAKAAAETFRDAYNGGTLGSSYTDDQIKNTTLENIESNEVPF